MRGQKIKGTKNACNKKEQTKICVNEKLLRRKKMYPKKGRDKNIVNDKMYRQKRREREKKLRGEKMRERKNEQTK